MYICICLYLDLMSVFCSQGYFEACDLRGAVLPLPYAAGAGYIFSAALLQWVATSDVVGGWVDEARGVDHETLQWQKYEDTSTGYWVSYLSIHLSIYPPIYLPIYPSTHLFIYLSIPLCILPRICLSIHLSIYICKTRQWQKYEDTSTGYWASYLSIHLSTHLSTHLSIHPSIHLSIYPSIYPSKDLSIHPSIYIHLQDTTVAKVRLHEHGVLGELSFYPSIHPSIYPIHPSTHLFIYLSIPLCILPRICLSIHLSIYTCKTLQWHKYEDASTGYWVSYLSIHPSIYPPIDLPIHPSTHLSIYLSVLLYILPRICLSIHLSIYICKTLQWQKYEGASTGYWASYLSIHLSINLPTHLSIIYPSIYLYPSARRSSGKSTKAQPRSTRRGRA